MEGKIRNLNYLVLETSKQTSCESQSNQRILLTGIAFALLRLVSSQNLLRMLSIHSSSLLMKVSNKTGLSTDPRGTTTRLCTADHNPLCCAISLFSAHLPVHSFVPQLLTLPMRMLWEITYGSVKSLAEGR